MGGYPEKGSSTSQVNHDPVNGTVCSQPGNISPDWKKFHRLR